MKYTFIYLSFLISFNTLSSNKAYGFNSSTTQTCAGFPRVTGYEFGLENKCLGLALNSDDVPWGKPRRIVFKDENTIIVSDMGSFAKEKRNIGAIWEVNINTKEYKKLYSGGDWTHGLAIDSKGRILFGDSDRILRLDPRNNNKIEVIIYGLPRGGTHPLSHFILLKNDDLILNIGAPSNDCKAELKNGYVCRSRDTQGHLRLYKAQEDSSYKMSIFSFSNNFDKEANRIIETEFFARGLRNSMALLYNPLLNEVYQVENNIDTPGTYEEFNIIPFALEQMYDYGWPFCKEDGVQTNVSRGKFGTFCSKIAKPSSFLIPPHSAPLDMMYYNGKEHPELRQSILMSWHGRRRAIEQALVAYEVDDKGAPIIDKFLDKNSIYKRSQPFLGVISGISQDGSQPKFTPVGITSDVDGRIWIVDDKNNAIVVFASSLEPEEVIIDEKELKRRGDINTFMQNISTDQNYRFFENAYNNFYAVQNCTSCHSSSEIPQEPKEALNSFLIERWFNLNQANNQTDLFFKRLHENSGRSMPPLPDRAFRLDHPMEYEALLKWANQYLKLN